MTSQESLPLFARWILVDPERIAEGLARLRAGGRVRRVPNEWQIFLGVLRMWHRMLFRSHTVGTSSDPIRRSLRARLFAFRAIRFPFLLYERAIAPLDFSGLLSDRARILSHLLGAHHDRNQFAYDLEMLLASEAEPASVFDELLDRATDVIEGRSPRADFLRDLVVFEGYHEHLRQAARGAREGRFGLDDAERRDPDISFFAYMEWCASQPGDAPATLRAWREGRYSISEGIQC